MRCEVKNGEHASFWYDNWTEMGPLINFLGNRGPSQLQRRQDARVVHATRNGQWMMRGARSEKIQMFLIF